MFAIVPSICLSGGWWRQLGPHVGVLDTVGISEILRWIPATLRQDRCLSAFGRPSYYWAVLLVANVHC
jgi:hypothetical protein